MKVQQYPKLQYHQILSLFNLYYPEDIRENNASIKNKRAKFRKIVSKYTLDKSNRLLILNPLNKINEIDKYYKIPLINEKEILINDIHVQNNHCGRDQLIQYIYAKGWYWYGLTKEIQEIIKSCPNCNTSAKFKKN